MCKKDEIPYVSLFGYAVAFDTFCVVLYDVSFINKLYEVLSDLVVLRGIFCNISNGLKDKNMLVEMFSPEVGVTTSSVLLEPSIANELCMVIFDCGPDIDRLSGMIKLFDVELCVARFDSLVPRNGLSGIVK